jgi:hypothetical protein
MSFFKYLVSCLIGNCSFCAHHLLLHLCVLALQLELEVLQRLGGVLQKATVKCLSFFTETLGYLELTFQSFCYVSAHEDPGIAEPTDHLACFAL